MTTLTHHKKSVRAVIPNQKELSFVSGAADNIKKWQGRDGKFLMNITGHNSVINCLAVNDDNVLVSAGDNGSLHFWDYETGYCFQKTKTIVQPGSLEAEAGVYAMSFDLSGRYSILVFVICLRHELHINYVLNYRPMSLHV
jgi:pleiotropic regulator 1